MIEHFFQCPYCWQQISMLIEPSLENISYIEDCEICCRPINIEYVFSNLDLLNFNAFSTDENF
ncbi:MAG: CPXCG motif-containing cysteine-rich protein [Flavobacteriaceae bacterium]|nr:CPXCG motif-containing cysteine-rich protein [Flavobacteriaceae bacterium]